MFVRWTDNGSVLATLVGWRIGIHGTTIIVVAFVALSIGRVAVFVGVTNDGIMLALIIRPRIDSAAVIIITPVAVTIGRAAILTVGAGHWSIDAAP